MANKGKRQPMKRGVIDFGYRNDDDRTATQRMYDRLYGNREVGDGSNYIAVNRSNWRTGLAALGAATNQQGGDAGSNVGSGSDAQADGHN